MNERHHQIGWCFFFALSPYLCLYRKKKYDSTSSRLPVLLFTLTFIYLLVLLYDINLPCLFEHHTHHYFSPPFMLSKLRHRVLTIIRESSVKTYVIDGNLIFSHARFRIRLGILLSMVQPFWNEKWYWWLKIEIKSKIASDSDSDLYAWLKQWLTAICLNFFFFNVVWESMELAMA